MKKIFSLSFVLLFILSCGNQFLDLDIKTIKPTDHIVIATNMTTEQKVKILDTFKGAKFYNYLPSYTCKSFGYEYFSDISKDNSRMTIYLKSVSQTTCLETIFDIKKGKESVLIVIDSEDFFNKKPII